MSGRAKLRRLVARNLARPETAIALDRIFDLGSSGGADIAIDRNSMIAKATVFRYFLRRRQSLNVVR